MKKLSIIIPVYNVEKYVERCIKSCINQDIQSEDYEIIIINDGSCDRSLEIIYSIVDGIENIKVFSQKNQGLSLTRNRGLSLANGQYVWFIDSDDWIEENCLKNVLKKLNDIEVLALGQIFAYDNIEKQETVKIEEENATNGLDLLKSFFVMPAQFYIYNKNFLIQNNILFYPDIFHEDFEFTPRVLYRCKKLLVYDKFIYFFYKRPGSITTTINSKKSYDLILIANSLSTFEKENVKPEYKYIFYNLISLAINNSLSSVKHYNNYDKKKLSDFYFSHKSLFRYLKNSTILKYKIEGYLFSNMPRHIVFIYAVLNKFKKKSI